MIKRPFFGMLKRGLFLMSFNPFEMDKVKKCVKEEDLEVKTITKS